MTTDSFFDSLKQNIRLTPEERSDIRASIVSSMQQQTAPIMALSGDEKADLFLSLADTIIKNPLAAEDEDVPSFTVWHGTLFRHLQPFVIR